MIRTITTVLLGGLVSALSWTLGLAQSPPLDPAASAASAGSGSVAIRWEDHPEDVMPEWMMMAPRVKELMGAPQCGGWVYRRIPRKPSQYEYKPLMAFAIDERSMTPLGLAYLKGRFWIAVASSHNTVSPDRPYNHSISIDIDEPFPGPRSGQSGEFPTKRPAPRLHPRTLQLSAVERPIVLDSKTRCTTGDGYCKRYEVTYRIHWAYDSPDGRQQITRPAYGGLATLVVEDRCPIMLQAIVEHTYSRAGGNRHEPLNR